MGLKDRLRRLTRSGLESFTLEDGTTYYFNKGGGELFLHTSACLRADYAGRARPAPPATLLALCKAKDRRAAAEKVSVRGMFPYDLEVLLDEGRLVARSMVASPPEDLPEP